MTYNGQELAALVSLGVKMAQADGSVTESEQVAIAAELVTFGVSSEQLPAILAASTLMNGPEVMSIVSAMSDNQKRYACGYLAAIMVADGDINNKEVEIWRLICTLGRFPEMTFQEALIFWKNN
jgi:uncharacterized tellurite resistance protein B-like protein